MDRHTLAACTFISQYRKSDVRVAKRQKEMQEEDTSIPKKIRKRDHAYSTNSCDFKITKNYEEDFDRSSYIETDDYRYSKKKKKKTTWTFKEKKPDNFRKIMDMDLDSYTFDKNTKKPIKNRNSRVKSDKNKDKRKEKERKKKNKKRLSLEEEHYGPLPKKKKNKSKKNKKDGQSIKQKTGNRGFKIQDLRFKINNQKR